MSDTWKLTGNGKAPELNQALHDTDLEPRFIDPKGDDGRNSRVGK